MSEIIREFKGKSTLTFPEDYVVVDIETTGLNPQYNEIIEIGCIRVRKHQVVDTMSVLLKSKEPVSPINTFAGCKLNNKNPKQVPIKTQPIKVTSVTPKIILITVSAVIIIVVTLVAKPSIPSVKFTALVVPSITTIANGIYA